MVNVVPDIRIHSYVVSSAHLQRDVIVDFYFSESDPAFRENCHLLFINDGQDLVKMSFENILSTTYAGGKTGPVFCVAIHCGADRKNEYGVVGMPDYLGRGGKAGLYEKFIFEEMFPVIRRNFVPFHFVDLSFCGFSLGGLTALDLVWRNPRIFHIAGVFSGSLWWRSVAQTDPLFDENKHRIMHEVVREGNFAPGLRFFFETGTLDETADRNNNGIIDSIDDTLALIAELEHKGYSEKDIAYLELKDGRHDVETWARAFPKFLEWAFGK